jgi:hypothetical protein
MGAQGGPTTNTYYGGIPVDAGDSLTVNTVESILTTNASPAIAGLSANVYEAEARRRFFQDEPMEFTVNASKHLLAALSKAGLR